MNKLIVARTYASQAWNAVNNQGIGRGGWLKKMILESRVSLIGAMDNYHGEDYLNASCALLELYEASNAVSDRDPEAAAKSLNIAVEMLGLMLEREAVPSGTD